MTEEIKKRINQNLRSDIPRGYQSQKHIGIAPSNWEVGKLSDVLHYEQRSIPKPEKSYWRLGLRSHAKGTFHELVEDPEKIDMDELFVVRENDLIVNITFAWEHAIALADKNDDGLLVSHRFPTYVFNDENSPYYFKYVVIQKRFKEMLVNISPGGAGRNRVMDRKDFLNLPCYIPPVLEQQKIAEILTQCDKVITLKKERIEEEKKQKKWLMQKLLDPDSGVRLPGFSGKWKKTRVGKVTDSFSGGTPKSSNKSYYCNNGISFIRSGEISASCTELFITKEGYDSSSAKMVNRGDILYALYGANSGECYISKMNGAINQAILCIRSKEVKIGFLYYVLVNLKEFIISTLLQGGQGNLSAEIVKKLYIYVPPIEEQSAITNIISAQDSKINLLEQELEQWQQKKKSLMQLLLTGIVRVAV